MILFLDTVSPLPEFSIIEEDKIIYTKKIILNNNEKMSDSIIQCYLSLEKKFSLNSKLTLLVTNTGPGSYTALRVGIAFLSGLALGKKINLIGITCLDLYNYQIAKNKLNLSAFFIASSNNQQFICIYDSLKLNYSIIKIDKQYSFDIGKFLSLKNIYTNDILALNNTNIFNNISKKEIRFDEIVLNNLSIIRNLPRKEIINPIYISDNKILN